MSSLLIASSRRMLALSVLLFASLLLALPAAAQVMPRSVTGFSVGEWQAYDGTGVTPNGQRTCPCTAGTGGARYFPGIGPFFKPIVPQGTNGTTATTVFSIGNAVGEDVKPLFPLQFFISTMSTIPSPGTPGGFIKTIMTSFVGGNELGTLSAGGAPGTLPMGAGTPALYGTNPLSTTIASDTSYMKFNGATTTFPSFAAVPAASFMVQFNPVKTAAQRFGGALRMANFSPNSLKFLDVVNGGDWQRTNGSYGGVPVGSNVSQRSLRVFQNTAMTSIFNTGAYHWWGWEWTTGKISGINKDQAATALITSIARTGSDVVTGGLRELSLVSPSIDWTPADVILGVGGGQVQAWNWDIQVLPEPGTISGLLAGISLLGIAYWRRGA